MAGGGALLRVEAGRPARLVCGIDFDVATDLATDLGARSVVDRGVTDARRSVRDVHHAANGSSSIEHAFVFCACHDGPVPSPRLILASASPARLELLRAAGIDPLVQVSGVDEGDIDVHDPDGAVATLARRKAVAVAATLEHGVVVGADSMLVLDGVAYGKPHTATAATARWRRQRGRSAVLVTGHHVIDVASARETAAVAHTAVHFADLDDGEVDAYVATGEPLEVAGAFTLDGYGSAFVEGVEGDPSNVIGLSLPLLRRLLADIGVGWTTLWR